MQNLSGGFVPFAWLRVLQLVLVLSVAGSRHIEQRATASTHNPTTMPTIRAIC